MASESTRDQTLASGLFFAFLVTLLPYQGSVPPKVTTTLSPLLSEASPCSVDALKPFSRVCRRLEHKIVACQNHGVPYSGIAPAQGYTWPPGQCRTNREGCAWRLVALTMCLLLGKGRLDLAGPSKDAPSCCWVLVTRMNTDCLPGCGLF